MRSDLEIVERCLLWLSKPGRWTQGVNARDRDGKPVPIFDERARSLDLEGVIRRAAGREDPAAYKRFVKPEIVYEEDGKLKRKTWPGPLARHIEPFAYPFDWNDVKGRTQKEVVNMLEDLRDDLKYVKGEAA